MHKCEPSEPSEHGNPTSSANEHPPFSNEITIGSAAYVHDIPQPIKEPQILAAGSGMQAIVGTLGSFHIRMFTARGLEHAAVNEVADDAVMIAGSDRQILLGVADGVGSEEFSDQCAQATLAGLGDGWRRSSGADLRDRLSSAVTEAARRASDSRQSHGSGASTLTAAALMQTSHGCRLAVAVIGDSPVYLLHPDRGIALVAVERDENGAGIRALPVHTQPAIHELFIGFDSAVLVMTDGFEDGLMNQDSVLRRFVEKTWMTAPKQGDFLQAACFTGDFLYDDRTIVGAWLQ